MRHITSAHSALLALSGFRMIAENVTLIEMAKENGGILGSQRLDLRRLG